MGLSKNIKMALLDKELKTSDLAKLLNIDVKVLSVKLSRDNLNAKSLESIANALNCDIKLVDRQTGKIF